MIDDADDGGIYRAIFHAGRHPRGTAAHDEDGFPDAGIDGIDCHQVVSVHLPVGIGRSDHEEFVTDETLVLAGRDDRPNDLGEEQGPTP